MSYNFDIDGDGRISYHEFKMILKSLGGHKTYNREMIKNKKFKKNKGFKNKNKKMNKMNHMY